MARMKKKSTFSARDERFAAKLEMPSEDFLPTRKNTDGPPTELQLDPIPRSVGEPTDLVPDRFKPMGSRPPANGPNTDTGRPKASARATVEKGGQEKASPIEVRLAFYWSADLTKRAAVWAEKARCSAGTILTKAWEANRTKIIEMMEQGVRHSDVPHENIGAAGARLSCRILLTPEAHARLTIELDPEGITGISSSLSRWVRQKASPMVDDYLKSAGY